MLISGSGLQAVPDSSSGSHSYHDEPFDRGDL